MRTLPFLFTIAALTLPAGLGVSAESRRSNLDAGHAQLADETEENDWLAYGRTHSERRFSPLRQINDGNESPRLFADQGQVWDPGFFLARKARQASKENFSSLKTQSAGTASGLKAAEMPKRPFP